MANYKNNKPKTYKGCCGMCCLRKTDGRRNGRLHTLQEEKFYMSADEEEREERRLKEDRDFEAMLDSEQHTYLDWYNEEDEPEEKE